MFNDNRGPDGEEAKPTLGFCLNASPLSVLESTTFYLHEWAFNLENGDNEIPKSHIKKRWGPRKWKGGLGEFNIFSSTRKRFANIILFPFPYREIKKVRSGENATLFS